jgi:CP family cyanate transporter-like MFS transporter
MQLPSTPGGDHRSSLAVLKLICLLWLLGASLRVTVGAIPPIIPLIHDDLGMSETQVGLLIGLPLLVWALAAVPGSLLITRIGVSRTLVAGLVATALAASARAAAVDVPLLYLATLLMALGIAVMQPALPTLVREWLPRRIGLATAVSSNGMLVGGFAGPALTLPMVLPLVGQSWRLDLLVWAAPLLVAAALLPAVAPRVGPGPLRQASMPRWWPDWKHPLTWLLGLSFGANNALYFGANAFLPDYLVSIGRPDLTAAALGSLAGSQLVASTLLLVTAEHWQRRAWPFLVFGLGTVAAVVAIALASGIWIVAATVVLGFSLAVTFVLMLAFPPRLAAPGEVQRASAGMFTIGYSCAMIIPVICGAAWDLTGRPWAAFIPLALSAVALTVLGLALSLHRPAAPSG